ncbi:unnamed protein product [Pedinophyceae sp. YPF-701]|nr:unnamed protein product [Pedinophyceae sp. YPF-701]
MDLQFRRIASRTSARRCLFLGLSACLLHALTLAAAKDLCHIRPESPTCQRGRRGLRQAAAAPVDEAADAALLTLELLEAARNGDVRQARRLVDEGADPAAVDDESGVTALHEAAWDCNTEMLQLFVAAGADVDAADVRNETALDDAAQRGCVESVRWLVTEGGADVLVSDVDGRTPLHTAALARRRPRAVVSALLDAAAAANATDALLAATDADGRTAADLALQQENLTLARLLGADLPTEIATILMVRAASEGDVALVREMLEAGADANGTDSAGITALNQAAWDCNTALLEVLVGDAGAGVDLRDALGETALHDAAARGCLSTAQWLVDVAGANATLRDAAGNTALHGAAAANRVDVVAFLSAAAPAAVDAANAAGRTALMLAAESGHVPTVQALLAAGADTAAADERGATASDTAVEAGLDFLAEIIADAAPGL